VEPGADDAALGTISIGADGAHAQPGDDAGSPRCDLVVQGSNTSTPGHTTLVDMVPAPRSSGVTPGFKAKPNAHSMPTQESSFHTCCTENGYRITNFTIYST
jgi:hypothetical protein